MTNTIDPKTEPIQEIGLEQFADIINSGIEPNYRPLGLFITAVDAGLRWAGIDNATGHANVEEWPTRELCEQWLRREIEPPDADDIADTEDA